MLHLHGHLMSHEGLLNLLIVEDVGEQMES